MNNDMDPGRENTQPISPYRVENYQTQSPYAPPPPEKRPNRRWLFLLLIPLILLIVVGAGVALHSATSTPFTAIAPMATATPSATATPVIATATAIMTSTSTRATTTTASPQPTEATTTTTATPPAGTVVVTVSPTAITVACGNATTTVTLTNPSTTQTTHWSTVVATGLYALTPSHGDIPPRGQQTMQITQVSLPGTVVVVSSGVPQTITITCTIGTMAQVEESVREG